MSPLRLVLLNESLEIWVYAVEMGRCWVYAVERWVVPRMGSQITANTHHFDVVKEFIYLGTAITTNNDVSLEIKRKVTIANK